MAAFTVNNALDGVTVIVAGNLTQGSVGTFGSGSILAVGVNPGPGGYFAAGATPAATGGTLGSFVVGNYDDAGTGLFGIVMNKLGTGGLKLVKNTLTASKLPFQNVDFCVRIVK